jgi:hypothetical protein
MKCLKIIAVFCSLISSAFAADGDIVLLRTQWKEAHFGGSLVTLLGKDQHGIFDEGGTANLQQYNDKHGCSDFLSKLFEFPLQKMRDQKYITQAEYEFYSKVGVKLDSRQIVFLNQTEISSKVFIDGKSVISNLLDPVTASSKPMHLRAANVPNQWLNTQASMWVVRGHVPDREAAGFLTKKALPWHLEPELEPFKKHLPPSKMEFEMGRAAKEDDVSYADLVKVGLSVAAHDAASSGIALSDARLYIHTLSDKMAKQMRIAYGFTEVAEKIGEHHLLTTTLADVLSRNIGKDVIYNHAALKAAFPDLGAGAIAQAEVALKKNTIHILDDPKAGSNRWILLSNQNQGPYLHEDLKKIDPRLNLMALNRTPFRFDKVMMAETDMSVAAAVMPGNDWGVSNLSVEQLKREPKYIERVLYEINGYAKDLNRAVSPTNPYNIVTERGFRITSTSGEIANRAKALGAEIKSSVIPGYSTIDLGPAGVNVNEAYATLYEIHFTPETAKKLIREYSLEASGRSFKRGYHQKIYDQINHL